MREAIGGTWLFQIVIVFILLFTGFMCLTINRTKAFNVKDQIIQTIQSYNGIDLTNSDGNEALAEITSYMKENAYRTSGVRPEAEVVNGEKHEYRCFNRDGKSSDGKNDNAVFCIAEIPVNGEGCTEGLTCFSELPNIRYYRIVVFYQLDLPIFKNMFNFRIVGDTKVLYGDYL